MEDVGTVGLGGGAEVLEDFLDDGAPVGSGEEQFGGTPDRLEDAITSGQGDGHAIDRMAEGADFVGTFHMGADGEVAIGDLTDDSMEVEDRLDQATGVKGGSEEADENTDDGDEAGSLVDGRDVTVVGFEGEPDMDPAPFDAGVIEGQGEVEGALVKDGAGAEGTGGQAGGGGGFSGEGRFITPAMSFGDDGEAVIAGDDQVINGGIATDHLVAVIHDTGEVEVDGGAGGMIAEGGGDSEGCGLEILAKELYLLGEDGGGEDGEGEEGNDPGPEGGSLGNIEAAEFPGITMHGRGVIILPGGGCRGRGGDVGGRPGGRIFGRVW